MVKIEMERGAKENKRLIERVEERKRQREKEMKIE